MCSPDEYLAIDLVNLSTDEFESHGYQMEGGGVIVIDTSCTNTHALASTHEQISTHRHTRHTDRQMYVRTFNDSALHLAALYLQFLLHQ